MSTPKDTLVLRVSNSYRKLSSAATVLNSVSNELGNLITGLDGALKKQSLGIEIWIELSRQASDEPVTFYVTDLGYAKIRGVWGIALRSYTEDGFDPDNPRKNYKEWFFNDAPRATRLEAVGMIPDLLEELSNRADAAASQVSEKVEQIRKVVAGIEKVDGVMSFGIADDDVPF
jgi:hypothetical protein